MNNKTIDDKEVLKFSKIAKDWWVDGGKFDVLHKFNHARVDFIKNLLTQNNVLSGNILDIGCGGGLLTEAFTKLGYNLTGIDAEKQTIEQAIAHASSQNLDIKYIHAGPEDLLYNNIQYDVIFTMEIIEHVENVDNFISVISKLLKPNGLIFFSTINRNLKSLLLAKLSAEYILNWLPKGTHNFNKFITPAELTKKLLNNNIDVLDIKGISFNILKKSWNLSQAPDVNYILCAKKGDMS